jgi:putative membrane protein
VTTRRPLPTRLAAVAGSAAVIGAFAVAPASAADGDVRVVNTETVQIYTSPTGEVETQRVYEQLVMRGNGSVDLDNPVSADGLRNLNGFGGFDVKDGVQVVKTSVDGEKHLRSVSDYDGDLPLDISVAYKLDGENVEPGDIVGADGELEVQYTVKNVTAQPQEVTFDDGRGGTVTKTVDVPIPMVGSLTTVAPPNFTNVRSEQANMAGDGKGGTQLSFTMTLFPPIGTDTAVVGYTAHVRDGVVPRANLSALPINPLASPTYKTAATSYQGGAESGVELTDGAVQIDSNLLKLRDGAGDLLAGLIQLRDGARQLQSGLAGEAAPGADKLAAGAAQLDDGLGQINDGTQRLAAGTGEAYAGGKQLDDGAGQLADGLTSLVGGLQQLQDGVAALPQTVTAQLQADPKFTQAMLGLRLASWQLSGDVDPAAGPSLLAGVNQVRDGLKAALPLVDGPMKAQLEQSVGALSKVSLGLNNPGAAADCAAAKTDANPANDCGIKQVLDALVVGLPAMVDQLTNQISGTLLAGIGSRTTKCDPEETLMCGAGALSAGAQQLRDGTGKLVAGLGQLDAGAGQLAAGTGQAADGSGQLADGAGQLARGLGDAANGSGRLADGLDQAADGAPKLVDGAQRLSDEGTSQLVKAGESTAQNYGEMYAVIEAGAKRAEDENMVFGAPEGAMGLAAYSYVIKGENGESGRNWTRGLAGLVLLGAGAGAFVLRRRTA